MRYNINTLVPLFKSVLSPVHCCLASRERTSKPTRNRKSEDCLVKMVKKQAIRHISNSQFSWESMCALGQHYASAQVIFLCNVVSDVFE